MDSLHHPNQGHVVLMMNENCLTSMDLPSAPVLCTAMTLTFSMSLKHSILLRAAYRSSTYCAELAVPRMSVFFVRMLISEMSRPGAFLSAPGVGVARDTS